MKRNALKKMQLSRETLRDLNDEKVREVAAGVSNTQATCYTCGNIPGPGNLAVHCV